jgi:hypothetical protein
MSYPPGAFPIGAFPDGVAEEDSTTTPCDAGVIPAADLIALAGLASSVTVDGQQTVMRPIQDVIALDKHLATRRAACAAKGNGWGSVGKSKVVPPSATGC